MTCVHVGCNRPRYGGQLCRRHTSLLACTKPEAPAAPKAAPAPPEPEPRPARSPGRSPDRLEDALWLLSMGESPEHVAARVGYASVASMQRSLARVRGQHEDAA